MIAIGLILVGLVGVITLINRSLGFSSLAFNKLVSSNLAQEGVEIVRNIRDTNWINHQAWDAGLPDGTYQADYSSKSLDLYTDLALLFDDTTGLYGYNAGSDTIYKRKIELNHISPEELQVKITISWIGRGGGSFDTVVEDHLFNWF